MTRVEVPVHQYALLHPGLVSSSATLLIATIFTDFLYWQSSLFQWNNFSAWLLTGGLLLAVLAAVALALDLALKRVGRIAWLRFAGLTIAALLSILNAFVHSRDAYAGVIPEGIILSGMVAILLLVVGLSGGWSLEARRTLRSAPRRDARP